MDSVIRWSQSQKWRWAVLWPDQHWSQKSMVLNLCMCSTLQQQRPLLSLRYGIISRETIQSHGLITWRYFILTSADNNMYMNLTSLPDNISIYKHKNILFSIMESITTLLLIKELILQRKGGQRARNHEFYYELNNSEAESLTGRTVGRVEWPTKDWVMVLASSPITARQREGEKVESDILFSWAPKSLWIVTAALKLADMFSLEGKPWQT